MKRIVKKVLKKIKTKAVAEKRLKLKLVLYFLIGLLFHTIGLIIAGLWIIFKTKLNKGTKFKSLLVGFVITMLISFSGNLPFVRSLGNSALFSKFPEIKPVYLAVKNAYPNYDVGYNINYNTIYLSSGTQKISTLTITLASTRNFPLKSKYTNVGRLVCTTLNAENTHIDIVRISFIKNYDFFGIPLYYYGSSYYQSCKNWLSNK